MAIPGFEQNGGPTAGAAEAYAHRAVLAADIPICIDSERQQHLDQSEDKGSRKVGQRARRLAVDPSCSIALGNFRTRLRFIWTADGHVSGD